MTIEFDSGNENISSAKVRQAATFNLTFGTAPVVWPTNNGPSISKGHGATSITTTGFDAYSEVAEELYWIARGTGYDSGTGTAVIDVVSIDGTAILLESVEATAILLAQVEGSTMTVSGADLGDYQVGDTREIDITVKDSDGIVVDISGATTIVFGVTAQDGTVLTKTGTPPGTPDMPFRTDGTDGVVYATIETGDFVNANAGNATFECGVLLDGNEYTVVTGILFIKPTML